MLTPAKILLFGEFTTINGGDALAMPLDLFQGQWKQGNDPTLQRDLNKFSSFLKKLNYQFIEADRFQSDLKNGWYFDSNIPEGYGVGSSGALIAATLKKYGDNDFLKNLPLPEFKKITAEIEGYFHGASSGTDPLVCYIGKTILIKGNGEIIILENWKKPQNDYQLFLLDTNHPRKAEPHIKWFLKQNEKADFQSNIRPQLLTINKQAIDAFLLNDYENLWPIMEKMSQLQFDHLPGLIPDFLKETWQIGLDSDLFKLKICGAGGGGFMIGVTRDLDRVRNEIDFEVYEI